MKIRWPGIVAMALPLVVFAADTAPPQELLDNLEFFQNFDLVKDPQFITHAEPVGSTEVKPSTSTVNGGVSDDAQ